jgi:Kelch motif
VVGGEQLFRGRTDLVYEYDPAHDSWQPRAVIPAALTAPTGVVTVHGRIYIVGGTLQSGFLNRVVYGYDPTADRWTAATRLPRPLVDHTNPVFTIGDRICVVAWPRRPFVFNRTVYSYDTVNGKWRQETPYKLGKRLALPSMAVVGRRVWIVGGFDDTVSPTLTDAVRVYDPGTGKLRPAPRFPETRAGAAVIYDRAQHALYAFAGVTVHGDETPTATDHAYMLRLPEFRKDASASLRIAGSGTG